MTPPEPSTQSHRGDVLLSWDRLGFRLLVFGGLGCLWIVQGRVFNQPWPDLIRGELAGLMPWAFLAPIVLAVNRRARRGPFGWPRLLGAHLLGMVAIFLPYLVVRQSILALWAGFAKGWVASSFTPLWLPWPKVVGLFVEVPFLYLLILLGAEAMRHAEARREEEQLAGRLAGQLAEAQLALLQRQLHPHFLFNALQAISTLLHRDPAIADALLMRLSTLLRGLLEQASGKTLALKTELDLTRSYLDIEQVRFADRLQVVWQVDPATLDVEVPSLIVLPLVENAIRHGLSPKVGPGSLTISTALEGEALVLTVADDGLGARLPLDQGVGLGNTRERLAALYGERAGLTVETQPGGGFRATIHLPLPEGRP